MSDIDKLIVTAVVVLLVVLVTLFVQFFQNRRGDRLGLAFLLLAVVSAIALSTFLWINVARAGCEIGGCAIPASQPSARLSVIIQCFREAPEGPRHAAALDECLRKIAG